MELTWYGRTCVRLRGKDAVVVADPFQSVVGPTGRGITGDIVVFSHPDDRPLPRAKGKHSRDGRTLLPSSLDDAFVLDGPGEYEVKEVLVTGVRTYRDDARGAEAGKQVSFVIEVDGVHTIHLGDIGHLLSEEKLGDIGPVDIACVPLGGSLSPTNAAAIVAQLDPRIVVPMPICDDDADCADALKRFFHEMGAEAIDPAEAVGDRDEPPGRDDDGPARVARQAGLTRPRTPPGSAPVEDDPPALDDGPRQVGGRPVRDLRRARDAPDDEVGALARLERADLVLEPDRARRVDGHRAERLVGRHPQLEAGDVIASGRLAVGDVPGLKSVPRATGMPRSMNVRAGAPWSFIRNQVVAGRTVATTGPVIGGRRASASIPASDGVARWSAGRCAELGRQLRATRRRELVGVEPERHPEAGRGLEDPPRLVRAEHAVLAEDVAEPGPAVGGDPGQLLVDDRADVGLGAVGPAAELGRDRVRAEVGRHDLDRPLAAEPVGGLDQPDLGLEVEAVAGLGLDRRDAVAEHLVEPAASVGEQVVDAGGPRRGDRREDAAARLEDLEVAGALLAEQPLALARTGEQQVGVRVDQARASRSRRRRRSGRSDRAGSPRPRARSRAPRAGRPLRSGLPSRPRPGRRARPMPPTSAADSRPTSAWLAPSGRRRRGSRPPTPRRSGAPASARRSDRRG